MDSKIGGLENWNGLFFSRNRKIGFLSSSCYFVRVVRAVRAGEAKMRGHTFFNTFIIYSLSENSLSKASVFQYIRKSRINKLWPNWLQTTPFCLSKHPETLICMFSQCLSVAI